MHRFLHYLLFTAWIHRIYGISEVLYSFSDLVHCELTLEEFFEHCCWIVHYEYTMTNILINQTSEWSYHLTVFWLFPTWQMNNPIQCEFVNCCLPNVSQLIGCYACYITKLMVQTGWVVVYEIIAYQLTLSLIYQ